jgi:large conductance mechanosensitive channel
MLKEFREFALRGNVLDLAVGIILGAAFGAIVNSLVNDIIMPIFGAALGGVDFSNLFIVLSDGKAPDGTVIDTLAKAKEFGAATINYGVLINLILNFLIVAFAMFLLIKGFNEMSKRMARKEEAKAEEEAKVDPALVAQQELTAAVKRLTEVIEKRPAV